MMRTQQSPPRTLEDPQIHALSIGLEVPLLALLLRSAWTWPRSTRPATLDQEGGR